MTNVQAILAGAALIAAAAFLGGSEPRAAAGDGRYVVAVAGGQPIAFVTDSASGETMACRETGCVRLAVSDPAPDPVAAPAPRAPEESALERVLRSAPAELGPPPTPTPTRRRDDSDGNGNALDLMRGRF